MCLRLAAPRRRNALTLETVAHLQAVLADHRDEVLLLGSTTPGIFCAGADLGVADATRADLSDRLYACYEEMVTRPGIVVAVVEGAAVGGGAQLQRGQRPPHRLARRPVALGRPGPRPRRRGVGPSRPARPRRGHST